MTRTICTLLMCCSLALCASGQGLTLEQKAIEQFCVEIDTYRDRLKVAKIYFDGKVAPRLSNIYDVAYCFGDIEWQEYMEQNLAKFDSISNLNGGIITENPVKVKWSKCGIINHFPLFKRRKYTLTVKRATHYLDSKSSVLLTMFHKPTGHFVLFSVLFDVDNAIVASCFSSFTIN